MWRVGARQDRLAPGPALTERSSTIELACTLLVGVGHARQRCQRPRSSWQGQQTQAQRGSLDDEPVLTRVGVTPSQTMQQHYAEHR